MEYKTTGYIRDLKALLNIYEGLIARYINIAEDEDLLYQKIELNNALDLANLFSELGEYKIAKIILEKANKSTDDENLGNVIAIT